MKKYVVLFSMTFILAFILLIYDNDEKVILTNSKSEHIINSNSLTMMYETDYQSGEYQVSSDNVWPQDGYVFNETLSRCENGGILSWNSETNKVIMQTSGSDKCYVYFDKEPDAIYLSDYIINNIYVEDGVNGLYYHDGVGTYGTQEAGDNSYRYTGANPNNYVCFGSDEETCPNDNLYRIIGVFENQVKLIKKDILTSEKAGYVNYTYNNWWGYYGDYDTVYYFYWRGNLSNSYTWENSTLNTDALNQSFINTLDEKWQNLIEIHKWQIGGNTFENIAKNIPKISYSYELGSNSTEKIYEAKIGLMYVSDYGYAASPDNWNTNLNDFDNDTNINNNWLYICATELFITPRTGLSNLGNFSVYCDEHENGETWGYVQTWSSGVARPTFYLNENVVMTSGEGTKENPYHISL